MKMKSRAGCKLNCCNEPITRLKDYYAKKLIKEHLKAGYRIIICPVCGNETFDNFFICPHCDWEYDDMMVDDYSSANNGTINDYKKRIGAIH